MIFHLSRETGNWELKKSVVKINVMIFREDELCFVLPLRLAQNPFNQSLPTERPQFSVPGNKISATSSNRTRGQKSLDDSALNSQGRD